LTITDAADVYRIKELDQNTEVYGIIAGDTSYSMSPYIHNAAFKASGLNAVFVPLQVRDLDAFVRRMLKARTREVELNLRGLSVTNPHKQQITKHLDDIEESARRIGAVNTIKVVDDRLHGFNTDAEGFIRPLRAMVGDLADVRVAVFGAGGAARACTYALKTEGSKVTVFARDKAKADKFAADMDVTSAKLNDAGRMDKLSGFDIVVNATPLGTRGEDRDETLATAEQLAGVKLVYDLVYNPAETRLLREAKAAGAVTLGGFDMLIAQAERQFEIWTGMDPPVNVMAEAARKRLDES
jgi:shikimate dehydrogenase